MTELALKKTLECSFATCYCYLMFDANFSLLPAKQREKEREGRYATDFFSRSWHWYKVEFCTNKKRWWSWMQYSCLKKTWKLSSMVRDERLSRHLLMKKTSRRLKTLLGFAQELQRFPYNPLYASSSKRTRVRQRRKAQTQELSSTSAHLDRDGKKRKTRCTFISYSMEKAEVPKTDETLIPVQLP